MFCVQLAWAPGKGVKAKEWKDYWEVEQGVSYIPWSKLSTQTDWTALEEGGSYDEETLPAWARPNSMVLFQLLNQLQHCKSNLSWHDICILIDIVFI